MSKRLTTGGFIEKAIEVHNYRYEYSLVDYINNHTKVKIKCKEHGYFNQRPADHLSGKGCPECGLKIWEYEIGNDALKEEQKILKEFSYAKWESDDLLSSGNTELFKFDVLGLDS